MGSFKVLIVSFFNNDTSHPLKVIFEPILTEKLVSSYLEVR